MININKKRNIINQKSILIYFNIILLFVFSNLKILNAETYSSISGRVYSEITDKGIENVKVQAVTGHL